ncbi:hypothetical protein FHT00_002167 [Sphingomonas insulae]|nr:hypothetical protein [Sphingomonas insulae]
MSAEYADRDAAQVAAPSIAIVMPGGAGMTEEG